MPKKKTKKEGKFSHKKYIADIIENAAVSPKRKLATAKYMNSSYWNFAKKGMENVHNTDVFVDHLRKAGWTEEQIIRQGGPMKYSGKQSTRVLALMGAGHMMNDQTLDESVRKNASEFYTKYSETRPTKQPNFQDIKKQTQNEDIIREQIRKRIVKLLKENKK